MSYAVAAYAVTLASLLAYTIHLVRRRRGLRAQISAAGGGSAVGQENLG